MNPKTSPLIICLLLLLGSLSALSPPVQATGPPGGSDAINITEDTTWDEDGSIDQQLTISAGATLTITSVIDVGPATNIVVSGTLELAGGSLMATEPPSDLQWWNAGGVADLWLPTDQVIGSGAIVIVSAAGFNLSGFTVVWGEGASEQMDGEQHEITLNSFPADGDWLTFEMETGSWGELVLDRIEIRTASTIPFEATDLDGSGWVLRGEFGFSLGVADGGTLSATDAEIMGADVLISGTAVGQNSWFNRSGPVNVQGAQASLTWNGGGFNGTLDDHDVRADGVAALSFTAVSDSGGFVDLWERQIPAQVLHFPGLGARFTLNGVGPDADTIPGISTAEGISNVPGDDGPTTRVVEIGQSDGTVWTESATIDNISWFTAWGTYTGGGIAIPHSADVVVEFPLPSVSISQVDVEDSAPTLGRRTSVTVTLANTGEVPANVPIECYDGGDRADISPTFPSAMVGADSEADIDLKWGHTGSGNSTLTCSPMLPTQLTRDGAFGGGSGDSAVVVWEVQQEAGLDPFVIALIVALVVGVLLVAGFASMQARESMVKTEEPEDIELVELVDLDDDPEEPDDDD